MNADRLRVLLLLLLVLAIGPMMVAGSLLLLAGAALKAAGSMLMLDPEEAADGLRQTWDYLRYCFGWTFK